MSIPDTIDLIQAVNRGVTGITSAPPLARYPKSGDTPRLPMALTIPGEGTFHHGGIGGGKKRQDRTYQIVVFVEPVAQSEFPTNALRAATVLQNMIETWLRVDQANGANVALADPPPYQVTVEASPASPHSDTGITPNQSIGGVPYHGFTINLRVRELW